MVKYTLPKTIIAPENRHFGAPKGHSINSNHWNFSEVFFLLLVLGGCYIHRKFQVPTMEVQRTWYSDILGVVSFFHRYLKCLMIYFRGKEGLNFFWSSMMFWEANSGEKTQLLSKMLQITTPEKHWLRFAAFHLFSWFIAASIGFSNELLNH